MLNRAATGHTFVRGATAVGEGGSVQEVLVILEGSSINGVVFSIREIRGVDRCIEGCVCYRDMMGNKWCERKEIALNAWGIVCVWNFDDLILFLDGYSPLFGGERDVPGGGAGVRERYKFYQFGAGMFHVYSGSSGIRGEKTINVVSLGV